MVAIVIGYALTLLLLLLLLLLLFGVVLWDCRDLKDHQREDFKEAFVINTISPVGRVRWRPGYPDQLATTSSVAGG